MKIDMNRKAVMGKIMLATISCIEKEGLGAVTVRNIAKEAEVNSAAINYYFGSKERLLEETFNFTLNHLFNDLNDILKGRELNSYSLQKIFLSFFLQGMINYPNLIKAFLFDPAVSGKYGELFINQFNIFLNELVERIKAEIPTVNERKIKISIIQMLSAVLAVGLPVDFFRKFFGSDLKDPENQKEYINHLLNHYVTWVDPAEIEKQNEKADRLLEHVFNSQMF